MCLIVFAWQLMPSTPLIAAANRDEFHDRPAAPASWWEDHPNIYAGRDLQAGGTWMGVTREGRFAAITNIRAPSERRTDAPSRGNLVSSYLASSLMPQEYVEQISGSTEHFNGFNLLVGNRDTLIWYSNRGHNNPRNGKPLWPGIYGLSNALLNDPWHKVVKTRAQFGSLLCTNAPDDAFFEMLGDTAYAPDVRLPNTGVDLDTERMLSAVCIQSHNYGTRTSTMVRLYNEAHPVLNELTIR
jgi:uncharacterized protein with NRDE domain